MTHVVKYEQQKQNLDYLKSVAKIASDSKQYQSMTESSLLNLMLSASDMGISPMKAINGGFYVVNGKVCMATSLMADRIRKAGHSIKITEMSREKCIIVAVRKDNGDSLKFEYSWEDATLAGLTGSPTWKKFPKLMLYNRCMSSVARILFSDVVGNCYSEEERFDIANIPAEKRPLEDPSSDLVEVMEIESPNPRISSEELEDLKALICDEIDIEERIKTRLKIQDLAEITKEDLPKIVRGIHKELEKREQEAS